MLGLLLMLQAGVGDVVVTGQRLIEEQAICARQACTPLRDAQTSIALAEVQFRAGEYLKARHVLSAAVARNRDRAATDPKPVAAIYEALATVAAHEGDQDVYKRAVVGQVRTLRDNLPGTDPAVLAAAPALGDMWVKLGDLGQAEASYHGAEKDAAAAGQDQLAIVLALKRAWLAAAMRENDRARRIVADVVKRPGANEPGLRNAIKVVSFRIAAQGSDDATLSRLAREIGRDQGPAPLLISAPPFPETKWEEANADARKFNQPNIIQSRSGEIAGIQWMDVGFWIRPDGRTAEAEILRGSQSTPWGRSILKQIEGRRYATSGAQAAAAQHGTANGIYRVERITMRSHYDVPIGSLIRRRGAGGGFEVLDLTKGDRGG